MCVERRLNKGHQLLVKNTRSDAAQYEIDDGVNKTLAQLVEMLHQAHAWQVGALAHGLAGSADCVGGVNHGDSPQCWGLRRGVLRGLGRAGFQMRHFRTGQTRS